MAISQSNLDAIQAAITDPDEERRFRDRSVRRRSISELMAANDWAEKKLADETAAAAGKPRVRKLLLHGGNE